MQTSTQPCHHLHDYNYNAACFQFPGRNTNYSHPHLSHIEDTGTNVIIITAFIGVDPAVCYEAVISVSCLLSNMPCSSENNRTLRICDRSCQAFNRLMASTFCEDFNHQILSLSFQDTLSPLQQVYRNFDCNDTST